MANEQLTIQPNNARMTVIGKSWPDTSTDSGGGDWDDTYNGTYSGPIPRTDLPTKIAVTTPPTKMEYSKLDRIDFDGMVVTAYNDDETIWTSAKYPDGTIPLNEIISTKFIDLDRSLTYAKDVLSVNITNPNPPPPTKDVNVRLLICNRLSATVRGNPDGGRYGRDGFTSIEIWPEDGFEIVVCPCTYRYQFGPGIVFSYFIARLDKPYDQGVTVGHRNYIDYIGGQVTAISEPIFASEHLFWGKFRTNVSPHHPYSNQRFAFYMLAGAYDLRSFECNLPLTLSDFYDCIGFENQPPMTDVDYIAYAEYGSTLQKNNEVILYWARPEDGKYLSCKLPIRIKPQVEGA